MRNAAMTDSCVENGSLRVLWLNSRRANRAPGEPPIKAKARRLLSAMRRRCPTACNLSHQKQAMVHRLMAMRIPIRLA